VEKEEAKVKWYEQQATEEGKIDANVATERIEDTRILYSNFRSMLARRMSGDPLA
jgi:hypothetical protein